MNFNSNNLAQALVDHLNYLKDYDEDDFYELVDEVYENSIGDFDDFLTRYQISLLMGIVDRYNRLKETW